MQRTTLQVNFKLAFPAEAYRTLCATAAPAIAKVPGLLWKLFTLDEDDSTAAGIYLFADRVSAEAYLATPIFGGLRSHPGITDLLVRVMDVDEELTQFTGPTNERSEGASR
jgi:Putative mono-oxygenase ydhR